MTNLLAVKPQLTHMGINVFDIQLMERFYTQVIGLVVTDRGRGKNFKADLVFLSADPATHHQVALASGRDPAAARSSTINQISFHLQSLDELRVMYQRVRAAGVQGLKPLNHGVSWSVYFFDPEGNTVELYVDSPWYIAQPHGDLFDPEVATEDILAATLAMCQEDPKFMPIEEFRAGVQRMLDKSY